MAWYRLFYHFVWTTKDRLPLITDTNRNPIFAAISTKITDLNGIVHALNGMSDHVHVVATLPLTIALSEVVRQLKGGSSHMATHLPDNDTLFAWQNEYGVLSVSETHLPIIIRYVQLQQQHHANSTLDPRLESTT